MLKRALGFCKCRQVFVHYLTSVLMTCKSTGGCIYQVASSEFHFTMSRSEKLLIDSL